MKFEELEQKTTQWGTDRFITINGKILTQTVKFGEEMGEYFIPAATQDMVEDAIGDMMVVLTMVTGIMKTYPSKLVEMYEDITEKLHISEEQDVVALYGEFCSAAIREDNDRLKIAIAKLITGLRWLAFFNSTTLEECWTKAYDEIKDRKGKLLGNGNFVKDEDLN